MAPALSSLPEPFRIGVRPLGEAPWLRLDRQLDQLRAEKAARYADMPRSVHRHIGDAGEPVGTGVSDALDRAGEETLALVLAALKAVGRAASPRREAHTPLVRAALDIGEDLALLVRDDAGWRLAEAFVAAPSAWRLADKIGLPIGGVHGPVPGFASGTRHDVTIGRMFDALRPDEPVVRGNGSLHADGERFLPCHAADHTARLAACLANGSIEQLVLRHERQVLHKLADSGAVLFSIDTTIRPVTSLAPGEGDALFATLASLSPEQRRYRGLPIEP